MRWREAKTADWSVRCRESRPCRRSGKARESPAGERVPGVQHDKGVARGDNKVMREQLNRRETWIAIRDPEGRSEVRGWESREMEMQACAAGGSAIYLLEIERRAKPTKINKSLGHRRVEHTFDCSSIPSIC